MALRNFCASGSVARRSGVGLRPLAIALIWSCGPHIAITSPEHKGRQPAADLTETKPAPVQGDEQSVRAATVASIEKAGPEFQVLGHMFNIERVGDACFLEHHSIESEVREHLDLELRWPCYVVPWRWPPPPSGEARRESDGSPLGSVSDARAYRFQNGVSAVVLLGGPLDDSDVARAGYYHCASTMRAVLIEGSRLRLSSRRATGGASLSCVEGGGPDQKEYWIFAH